MRARLSLRSGRGRNKPVDLRAVRRRKQGVRAGRGIIAAVVFVVALGTVAAFAWKTQSVEVIGAREVSAEAIVRASGIGAGDRMLLTRLNPVRRRVLALAQIASVRVSRRPWATLRITVTERVPLAHLDSRPQLAADREGVLFPVDPDRKLPVLSGWRALPKAGLRLDRRSRAVLDGFPRFPEPLRAASTLRIEGGWLVVVLEKGTEVRFGRIERLQAKASAANAVLADAGAKGVGLAYVDVRAPRTPVAKPDEPSPSPSVSARAGTSPGSSPASRTPRPSPKASPKRPGAATVSPRANP